MCLDMLSLNKYFTAKSVHMLSLTVRKLTNILKDIYTAHA